MKRNISVKIVLIKIKFMGLQLEMAKKKTTKNQAAQKEIQNKRQ